MIISLPSLHRRVSLYCSLLFLGMLVVVLADGYIQVIDRLTVTCTLRMASRLHTLGVPKKNERMHFTVDFKANIWCRCFSRNPYDTKGVPLFALRLGTPLSEAALQCSFAGRLTASLNLLGMFLLEACCWPCSRNPAPPPALLSF